MKLRATMLLLVSMLLIGSLAGAATTDAPAAPAVAASPIVAAPLCLAAISANSSPNTPQAKLPIINPVVEKSVQLCGACSDIRCANNTLGALCQTGKRCYNLYGNVCSQDGQNQCTCYSGPLP